jgi:1-aminocyclopropane-1-carboxylate deaminase/D-cysteine desulfhydrase-like pyridoxal-dependent ACC family enzyme
MVRSSRFAPPLSTSEIRDLVATQPRIPLACLPTPLQEAKRLTSALRGPRIFIKRDDLTGLAFGGNKSRNLEFRMVEPVRAEADVLIMALEITSNSARQTVAAGNKLGMRTVLVLKGDPPGSPQGNLLINHLLGAEVHYARDADEQVQIIERVAEEVRRAGERPMVLTSEPIFDIGSALAYLESTVELIDQMSALGAAPDYLYMASGGKGQAGQVLARRLLEAPFLVHGITVSYEYDVPPRTARIANDTLALLGLDLRIDPSEVVSFGDHVGAGYGHLTPEGLAAVELVARTEGVVLDPIYTGKAFAALLDHIERGIVPRDATVAFVHTGGTPAVFTHAEAILAHLDRQRAQRPGPVTADA